MQREEKQLEVLLEAVLVRLNDLKNSIGAMIHKLETEYETLNWPTFLDNFALISSHLTGLSKILSKDFGFLRNRTVLPLKLSPETDDLLLQLTEGRVPVFSHDIVPDYLRTKPEPAAEQRMLQHEQKANNLLPETAMKQFAQYNKVISHVFDMVNKSREDWENETNSRTGPSQINSLTDTHALVAAIGMGKSLKMPMQVSAPGMMPPAPGMMPRPSAPMGASVSPGVNPLGKTPTAQLFSMAFYSVRVNEEGKEIELPRTPHFAINSNRDYTTSCAITSKYLDTNPENNYKTVRYVNSAAFIEKDVNPTKQKHEEEKYESRSNNSLNSSDDEISDHQYQSHIIMANDIHIPILELNSNESFPSSNETMSYSYSKIQEVTKIIQKPDAYREWLNAKKLAKLYQAEQIRKVEERKEFERTQKKIRAENTFKEWLAIKSEKKSKENRKIDEENEIKKNEYKNFDNSKLNKKDHEKNFSAWLRQKSQKETLLKEKLNRRKHLEFEVKQKRKDESIKLYEKWLESAPLRPKPVPLNKGLYTLKGSISDIFINPTPWLREEFEETGN